LSPKAVAQFSLRNPREPRIGEQLQQRLANRTPASAIDVLGDVVSLLRLAEVTEFDVESMVSTALRDIVYRVPVWSRSADAGITATSDASRLLSGLSAVMLSSKRSWNSAGRKGNRPSAIHADGLATSKPA